MPTATASELNGVSPTNLSGERALSQWLFTTQELLSSPSILEGLPVVQELANRQKGVNFITQVGIMLKLPQLTLATASVFLHRFYMRHPMQVSKDKGIHHYAVAATALFLATKVEENCRKMKELIVACCRVAQKQPNLVVDDQSKEYWRWRDTILYNEDLLLETLCFDLQLEQPYRILFEFLCYYGVQEHKVLRNTSWAFLNDSHITTLCLLLPPRTIAGSALYAGVKLAGITLPDDEAHRAWWQHLGLDVFDIQTACNQMAEVYQNPMLPRQGQKEAYTKDDDETSFDRTRRMPSPNFEPSPTYSMGSASQGAKREKEEDSWGSEDKTRTESRARSLSANALAAPSPKRLRTEVSPSVANGNDSTVHGSHHESHRLVADSQTALPPVPPASLIRQTGAPLRSSRVPLQAQQSQHQELRRPNGSASQGQVPSAHGGLDGTVQQNPNNAKVLGGDHADAEDLGSEEGEV